mgnify:FL=1
MDAKLVSLIAASAAFVGSHFLLSHPLRARLVAAVGPGGFQALYSLFAFAGLGWMVMAFVAIGPQGAVLWDGTSDAIWALASLLTLIASVLLLGSFMGNPALPAPNAAQHAARGVHGVFHVTRHPMMWAIALWGVAHILVRPDPRTGVLAGSFILLALLGSHFQDRKKQELMGGAWQVWQAQTSFWPRPLGLLSAGIVPWLGGLVLWLGATWAHVWLVYIPAGVWRWLG